MERLAPLVVSLDRYKNSAGAVRDARTAKPQMYRTGDGRFICNLVTNLAKGWWV